ncbi:MAG: thioredoxin [Herbiconiux sp.]|uniref:TlpA family protein disulfide reductase n=1 Tax=Herbiconiux sp. TaxID=1871186 RepID=UPI001213060E|nr:thioredoxin family protein [Herbiconiux sp.]TAJ49681.1 MAG: thioredoxin [Herbiconiux sp.]
MNPLVPLVFAVGLVTLATLAGVVWKARQGAARSTAPSEALDPQLLAPASGTEAPAFGRRATLVQFSTEFCASCPSTRRVLSGISAQNADVAYLDVDVTDRADLVRRFSILQTPTTLILDRDGVVRTRIGGAVRPAVVEARLKEFV